MSRFKIYKPGMAPMYNEMEERDTASVYLEETGEDSVQLMLNDGNQRHIVGTFSDGKFYNSNTLSQTLWKEHSKDIEDMILTIGDSPKITRKKEYVALKLKKAVDGSIFVAAVNPYDGSKIHDGPLVKIKPNLSLYFYKNVNSCLDIERSPDLYRTIYIIRA